MCSSRVSRLGGSSQKKNKSSMIASIASPVQNQQESLPLLFFHLLQPTITTQSINQSIHRCQLSTLKLLINLVQSVYRHFSSASQLLVGPHSLLLCSYTPLSPRTTSDIAHRTTPNFHTQKWLLQATSNILLSTDLVR